MAENKLSIYDLTKDWFDFCFENPEKINPNHSAIYFFILSHSNRLGWKPKIGLPTTMTMEAVGIKSYNTYTKHLADLIGFGFIKLIEKSTNQYSSNIIAISKFDKALDKALDKATVKHLTKHHTKQRESTIQSTVQSNDSIIIPIHQYTNTSLLSEIEISDVQLDLIEYFKIAKEFQRLFIKNLKEKNVSTVHQEKATFKNYVDPVRLMLTNKECTVDDLREVWNYLESKESEFWKKNILSTATLRKQIVTLIMEARKFKPESKKLDRL